ncbi:peptidoglycan-binding protein [Streptomyces sp. NPDC004111]|uniref:peptidoglycan-binding domain-containing protein n=1 Tax=Streptomyces sp. NPDC004111 TaxID=3364690 RepID=UPI0036827FDE
MNVKRALATLVGVTALMLPLTGGAASAATPDAAVLKVSCRGVSTVGYYCGYSPYDTYLSKGDNGPSVKELQAHLVWRGISVGSTGIDGDFGTATYNALRTYQRTHGLAADGIAGPNTWNKLRTVRG